VLGALSGWPDRHCGPTRGSPTRPWRHQVRPQAVRLPNGRDGWGVHHPRDVPAYGRRERSAWTRSSINRSGRVGTSP